MKLFYMIGSNYQEREIQVVYLDLKKPSESGTTFITLYTAVDSDLDDLEADSSSVTAKLDLHRPSPGGDAQCKVVKGRSSAKYYTGFVPVLRGYNGENGLVRRVTVLQCDQAHADTVAGYVKDTVGCYDDDYFPYKLCKSILFIWTPGSEGERMEEGTGMKAARDEKRQHFLLVQVLYAAGTGFLSDDSGLKLFYTGEDRQSAGKMMVGHTQSNNLLIMPGEAEWKTTGLCPYSCLAGGGVESINISSVSLHAGDMAGSMRMVAVQEGGMKTVVSGFRSDYQPVRRLYSPHRLDTKKGSLVVECVYSPHNTKVVRGGLDSEESEECFAVITYTPKIEITECTSEPSRENLENVFGLNFNWQSKNDEEMLLYFWNSKSTEEKYAMNDELIKGSLNSLCLIDNLTIHAGESINKLGLSFAKLMIS